MSAVTKSLDFLRTRSAPLRIASIYCVAGVIWVACSDGAVLQFIENPGLASGIETAKGLAYVLATSALLYLALARMQTRRRSIQRQLRRSEKAYRAMFDDNPNPMFVYAADTLRFLAINRAALRKYGYRRDEFLRMTLHELYEPASRAVLQRKLNEHLSRDDAVPNSAVHHTKSAQRLVVEITVTAVQLHGSEARLMVAQDISARARTESELLESRQQLKGALIDLDECRSNERKLQDSERQYRQLIDNLPAAIFIHRERKIIFANPMAVELFGAGTPEALLGVDVGALVATADAEAAATALQWLLAGPGRGDRRFREHLLRRAGGDIFAAEVAVRPIVVEGGHCVQVIVRDIGAEKKNQQELRLANERLLHLSTNMIEFSESERLQLSRELHDDLGQSLTFIKMTAAWLRKRLEHDELGPRVVQLHGAAGEALTKVRDLSLALRPAQLDTRGLKAAVEEHLQKFCEGGGIHYKADVEELLPRPDPAIETAVFRIFQEALTNVFRHSAASFIEVSLAREADAIRLRLVDDGCGFNVEEALGRGASLGLHTMQERARQLGGRVHWQSVIGVGTELTATIPAIPAPELPRPAASGFATTSSVATSDPERSPTPEAAS